MLMKYNLCNGVIFKFFKVIKFDINTYLPTSSSKLLQQFSTVYFFNLHSLRHSRTHNINKTRIYDAGIKSTWRRRISGKNIPSDFYLVTSTLTILIKTVQLNYFHEHNSIRNNLMSC